MPLKSIPHVSALTNIIPIRLECDYFIFVSLCFVSLLLADLEVVALESKSLGTYRTNGAEAPDRWR